MSDFSLFRPSGRYLSIRSLWVLSPVPAPAVSRPVGMNNAGQVIGVCTNGTVSRGFLYTNGVLTDLGALIPLKINDFGQIISANAELWTPTAANAPTGSVTALPLPGFSATDLNNYGQVSARDANLNNYGGAFWTPSSANGTAGSVTDLGNFPAIDINNFGQVIAPIGEFGDLWTPDTPNGSTGVFTEILPAQFIDPPWARSLSEDGTVTLISWYDTSSYVQDPLYTTILWLPDAPHSASGHDVEVGPSGGGGRGWNTDPDSVVGNQLAVFSSASYDCGDGGECVGQAPSGFLWTPAGGIVKINSRAGI